MKYDPKYDLEKPDERIWPLLKQYSTGDISASDAAYEIKALKIPGYSNPSVSEVMLWSRAVGYGLIPDLQTEEEAKADAERIFKKMQRSDE